MEMKVLAVLLMMIVSVHALIFFSPTISKCQVIQTLRTAGAHEEDLRNCKL